MDELADDRSSGGGSVTSGITASKASAILSWPELSGVGSRSLDATNSARSPDNQMLINWLFRIVGSGGRRCRGRRNAGAASRASTCPAPLPPTSATRSPGWSSDGRVARGSRPVPGCDRARCEDRCRIGRGWGVILSVSVVPSRWRREPLSSPTMSGRYLSFSEREDIALLRAESRRPRDRSPRSPGRRRRSRVSCVGTRRREHGGSTTRRRSRSGGRAAGASAEGREARRKPSNLAQDRLAGEVKRTDGTRPGRSPRRGTARTPNLASDFDDALLQLADPGLELLNPRPPPPLRHGPGHCWG